MWTRAKGCNACDWDKEKGKQWLLANWQELQNSNFIDFELLKLHNFKNYWTKGKAGCPKRLCQRFGSFDWERRRRDGDREVVEQVGEKEDGGWTL